MGYETKARCWLTMMRFSPEVPRNIRWLLHSRSELSSQRGVTFSGLKSCRAAGMGETEFSSNTLMCPTWLIPYDRGQQCRFHWFPGHAVTWGALPVVCSNEYSLCGGTGFSETATPCHRASRSSQSSGSASEPPKQSRKNAHSVPRDAVISHTHNVNSFFYLIYWDWTICTESSWKGTIYTKISKSICSRDIH